MTEDSGETSKVRREVQISTGLLLACEHRPYLRDERVTVRVGWEAATVKAQRGWINQTVLTGL